MRKKLIWVVVTLVTIALVGCGNKEKDKTTREEYKDLMVYYQSMYEESEEDKKELKEVLKTYGVSDEDIEDINETVIFPDGNRSFLNINDSVFIGKEIDLSPINRVPNQSMVYINDVVGIKPTKNWTMRMEEEKLVMEHSTGVYSEIISYDYAGENDGITCYSEMFIPYLEELGYEDVDTKLIFVGEDRVGYTTEVPVKTKGKKGEKGKEFKFNFGLMIGSGKVTVFKFFYEQLETDAAFKELVNSTVSNITLDGVNINIE